SSSTTRADDPDPDQDQAPGRLRRSRGGGRCVDRRDHPAPGRRLMKRALLLAAVAAALLAPAARADGDPASDVLYTQWVFFPFEFKYGEHEKQALLSTVDDARKHGYPIKVALITQRYDLGAIPALFGKPQQYAHFLGL